MRSRLWSVFNKLIKTSENRTKTIDQKKETHLLTSERQVWSDRHLWFYTPRALKAFVLLTERKAPILKSWNPFSVPNGLQSQGDITLIQTLHLSMSSEIKPTSQWADMCYSNLGCWLTLITSRMNNAEVHMRINLFAWNLFSRNGEIIHKFVPRP